jgi:hypothetical protein
MARGPLPNEKKSRRNKDTIPTTQLPASGRKGRPPAAPKAYKFGNAAKEWWKWAWGLPQAMAWDKGALYVLARRAQLEDEVAALDESDDLIERIHDSFLRILETDDPLDLPERLTYLGLLMAKLKGLAGGRVTLLKEMRELDKVLGLTPKAMAELRWKIVDDGEAKTSEGSKPKPSAAKQTGGRRGRLTVVA